MQSVQLPGDDNSPSHIPTNAKVVFYLRAGFANVYHVCIFSLACSCKLQMSVIGEPPS